MNKNNIEEKVVGKKIPKKPKLRRDIYIGVSIIVIFFLLFGGWAVLAPIESAAVAPGKVIVAGKRRLIQHLEGGIVEVIYVRDGSRVKKGDKLLQIEDTRSEVTLELAKNEFFELALIEARILAELSSSKKMPFPARLKDYRNNVKARDIYENQLKILHANETSFNDEINLLKQKIAQLQEQRKGEEAQLKSFETQQKLIDDELKDVEILYKKQLVERSRYLSLQREKAKLGGSRGEKIATIASIKQKVAETNQEIATLQDKRRKELLTELRETRRKLSETIEQTKAATDVHKRTTIVAPVDGTIVAMSVHTIGQVVKAGETLMEIVPAHERLVIEAEVNPNDIDVVRKGLKAKVQLTAFKSRTTPALLGKVTHVSADSYVNEKTDQTYYSATVEIDSKELKKLGNQKLYPGMRAEVMIITDKLTPWGYIVGPIKRSFQRAFRED